jgi:hypothetical protein
MAVPGRKQRVGVWLAPALAKALRIYAAEETTKAARRVSLSALVAEALELYLQGRRWCDERQGGGTHD